MENLRRLMEQCCHVESRAKLTRFDLLALIIICEHAEKDRTKSNNPSALAARVHCSGPTMTRILRRLEESGFVSRKIDEKDRRSFIIMATLKGANVVKQLTNTQDGNGARKD